MPDPLTRTASCCCGNLKAHCQGQPVRSSICHCLECQKRTGSAFGYQSRWPREQVRLEGHAKVYRRTGDTGKVVTFYFCPECGSTVYWEIPGMEGFWAVAVGAFGDPDFMPPTFSVYEDRRHEWTLDPNSVIQDHWN